MNLDELNKQKEKPTTVEKPTVETEQVAEEATQRTEAVEQSTVQQEQALQQAVPQQPTALPDLPKKAKRRFALRMGDAGYVTGRRYDAIKNEFLSYRSVNGKSLRTRFTVGSESFGCGNFVFARLGLVGGYLRLYLALDPTHYNNKKFHHKDLSGVAKYANTPLMIKLSSNRQVANALLLIEDLMKANGFEKNPDFVPTDHAAVFDQGVRRAAASVAATAAMPRLPHKEAVDVTKAPKRGGVYDRAGNRIGKVRKGVWYDKQSNAMGDFRKEDSKVFLYHDDRKVAYLDVHDNVMALDHSYKATLKRTNSRLLLLILVLAFLATSTLCVAVYFWTNSQPYAPTLFVADQSGTSWDDLHNIPVFFNKAFGDTVIAPGHSGSYAFTFENRNANGLVFSFNFDEDNHHNIDLRYRLKRDGSYIAGGSEALTVQQLSQFTQQMTIEANSNSMFVLEWEWLHNDETDTIAGESQATYTLHIAFSAFVGQS